ncbi:MAG: YIP1 family protein [Verrucomicrobiae bacterium]|nr:YIP1 family protein [Verrucomicrobiae bacterium]
MIKALLLIFEPVATWERIVQTQRRWLFVLTGFLLPLLLLTSLAEGFGLVQWGVVQKDMLRPKEFGIAEASVYLGAQALLSILIVIVAAWLIKSLGETFHGRHSFGQAFTAVAYGLSPLFAFRVLDAFPVISPWVAWGIGILLSTAVLYHGLPRVMLPDPPHAFGLYLMSVILLIIITGLARFVTAWYLAGRFKSVERMVVELIT